jgi:hypothetical protein
LSGGRITRPMMSHGGNALRVANAILAWIAAAGVLLASATAGSAASQRSADMLFASVPRIAGGYFIDFRARPSTYIGHTYIVYGRIDARGRLVDPHYAGLIPFKQPWRGLFVPIQASVQQYIDDTRRTPSAIYRVPLTAGQYRAVVRRVEYLRAQDRVWHAVFLNCNDFANQIAETLDMLHPPSTMPPPMWVALFRLLNEGRNDRANSAKRQ